MLVLRRNSGNIKRVLSKGKSALLDETLDNWKRYVDNPGKAVNENIVDIIEHPVASGIESVVEGGLGLIGKVPGLKVPGVSKAGRKVEDILLPSKVKKVLAKKSKDYKDSKIADKVESRINRTIDKGKSIITNKSFSDREKVPADIEEKAKNEGVIQKDSSGRWRIISLKTHPAEYWNAHYKTREDAEKALGAYHANK